MKEDLYKAKMPNHRAESSKVQLIQGETKMINYRKLMLAALAGSAALALSTGQSFAADRTICNPGGGTSGFFGGDFYSFFEASSENDVSNCDVKIRLRDRLDGRFNIDFNQNQTFGEDAVGGMGWRNGSDTRTIRYRLNTLTSNSTSTPRVIAGVYGWTCGASDREQFPRTAAQEYYIVNSWGGSGAFVPFDENIGDNGAPARPLRRNGRDVTVSANGGTYKIYKIRRNGPQYCGDGQSRSFDQFWSVRTSRIQPPKNSTVSFSNHDNKWDDFGFSSDKVRNGYQIVFGEAFGDENFRHSGKVDMRVNK